MNYVFLDGREFQPFQVLGLKSICDDSVVDDAGLICSLIFYFETGAIHKTFIETHFSYAQCLLANKPRRIITKCIMVRMTISSAQLGRPFLGNRTLDELS